MVQLSTLRTTALVSAWLGWVLFAAAGVTPLAAQIRLTDQSVRGWKRICSYSDTRPAPSGSRASRGFALEIGRGEPCPAQYRPPAPAETPRRTPTPLPQLPAVTPAPQG